MPRSLTAMTAMALSRPLRGERGAVDRVDGDVDRAAACRRRRCSPLKSIGASSFSPSPITTMPSIGTVRQDGAHGVDGGPVGAVLVAPADPAGGGERRRLGDPHQLHRQVAVGLLGGLIEAIATCSPYRAAAVDGRQPDVPTRTVMSLRCSPALRRDSRRRCVLLADLAAELSCRSRAQISCQVECELVVNMGVPFSVVMGCGCERCPRTRGAARSHG